MDFQNCLATADIGQIDHDLTIKSSGAEQGRVKDIRPVRGSDDDDAFLSIKAVHLNQQRIKRLLAFVVATAEAMTAAAANRVDFVNENQTGRILARLFKHVADAACANADE